eukprot:scaffold1805_cov69-Cyclotella_meneghiniana.AAC.3
MASGFMDEPAQIEPIKVCLRLRPINSLEESRRSHNCVTTTAAVINPNNNHHVVGDTNNNNNNNSSSVVLSVASPLQGPFSFAYDAVFDVDSSQANVYDHAAAPLASSVLEGFNCALIAYGQTGSGKTYTMMGNSSSGSGDSGGKTGKTSMATDNHRGMIPRLIHDVFRQMTLSSPTVEYIVKCSFVEIYLEKVMDLLSPVNRSIRIVETDCSSAGGMLCETSSNNNNDGGEQGTVRLEGASEACCFTENDCISLLIRGNACRSVSSTKMNTDSSRSHAVYIMKIEQRDNATGISKVSQLTMMDMAGSELGKREGLLLASKDAAIYQEATMINKSLASLNSVVNAVVASQNKGGEGEGSEGVTEVPYNSSKLTRLLRDAIGGNCKTSLILTASPASYNIDESIRTMKFGECCKNVNNHVKPSVEMSPVDYRKLLNNSQKKQEELIELVNELSAECFQLKQDARNQNFVESNYNGPLWETVEAVLVNGAAPVVNKSGRIRSNDGSDVVALKEELAKARAELDASKKARDHLENLLSERQSEVAVLRTQNDNYSSEKKRNFQELITVKAEIRMLSQRKQEVEHNLRTSQFREYEATVFLRQFRRFYRRLLRNKAAQGTGGTSDVIEKVPGVPDLNDLIDVDTLLLESGLIEESELHDDAITGTYRPSAAALGRSTEASSKAWKEAASLGKVEELTALDRASSESRRRQNSTQHQSNTPNENSDSMDGADAGAGASKMPYGQTITNRQQFLGTPAGKLTAMRERELERDLLRATERCIELQVALNEEKANVDILTNRAGNMNKKKFAQESIQLKQQLEKKTHDLQAIIWKMNELHLINKTYNEKMSNREQHVTYLEENLVELQGSNRSMIMERQEAEDKLREELESLKVLVDAMTIPLWQFGEGGVAGQTLASRIRLPVRGGEYVQENGENDDGEESMGSFEESIVSGEDDDEEEVTLAAAAAAPEPAQQVQIIQQNNVPMRDASTQTQINSKESSTMTDMQQIAPPPQRTPGTYASAVNAVGSQERVEQLSMDKSDVSTAASYSTANSSQHDDIPIKPISTPNNVRETPPSVPRSPDDLFRGGKSSSSQPRRSVQKFSLMIRPGVLKESSSKSKEPSPR